MLLVMLWTAAIGVAFCLWDSISRSNEELEAQRIVVTLRRRKDPG
jgi:hypothetical protein